MNRALSCLAVFAFSLGVFGSAAAAGNTASHTVTIRIPSLNLLRVQGNTTINLGRADNGDGAGGNGVTLEGTDESATLSWLSNAPSASPKSITVQVEAPLPEGVTLNVQVDLSGKNSHGSGTGPQELSTSPIDVVRGIYAEVVRDAPLKYEANVTAEADLSADVARTVIYTITD